MYKIRLVLLTQKWTVYRRGIEVAAFDIREEAESWVREQEAAQWMKEQC
jgi:hypothetical protein